MSAPMMPELHAGYTAIAKRLRHAFGDRAELVAREWAETVDPRYRWAAELLAAEPKAAPVGAPAAYDFDARD